ncbi:bifunctional metallophosphatase/5'-nucleotidase [Chroococcidiopsis sp. CCALA 051]|uniref:bifunctional metallophosphatase/5'-nucleotidase n=1 Tax=Chroococcidiopsis sp. CCALA 051 TaxID=869949 RepID=UPI000D0DE470|nr:bifunctional metallophosphatase/5'-nucleotidase [Chroococcidiopsis sp. CCALA 051]PSM47570.1 bifunctional metallophosphatase/5'-nucleotidase [Chroococcidiopsis sp. CCALA 051]
MKSFSVAWGLVLQVVALCIASPALAEVVEITLLHLNDVYEIAPVDGGKRGGLARVATLRQELLSQNPRTYTVLAGDAFSPSALGTAKVNGKPLAGQHMVAVMNAVGFDYATFGNHEFDLAESEFFQRLKESQFKWISSNVRDNQGKSFPGVAESQILNVKSDRGTVIRVGLIGLTIDSNKQKYVSYAEPIQAARTQVAALKGQVDFIVALTHLNLAQDQKLAAEVPEIDLILGGHEHENIQQWRGEDFTPLFKADANARSVYIHNLRYDIETKKLVVDSQLQSVTEAIPEDPRVAKVVNAWIEKAYQGFRAEGFAPEEAIATTNIALDGLESSVRNRATNLTALIAQAMLREAYQADLAIFNSGSIRIDDVIPPGRITQYDIIRVLPFGGKVLAVEMKGSLLEKVLEQGQANRGTGGFLQTANVSKKADIGTWMINGEPLEKDKNYRVAINDFLMSGQEQGLEFLNFKQKDVKLIYQMRDLRFVAIDRLKDTFAESVLKRYKSPSF